MSDSSWCLHLSRNFCQCPDYFCELLTLHFVHTATAECRDDSFSDQLCIYPEYVDVQSAKYVVSTSNVGCVLNEDCSQDVQQLNPLYYTRILAACNGKQACDSLVAEGLILPNCRQQSDYVEITFQCVERKLRFPCVFSY